MGRRTYFPVLSTAPAIAGCCLGLPSGSARAQGPFPPANGPTTPQPGSGSTEGIYSSGAVSFSRGGRTGGIPVTGVILIGCAVPTDHTMSGSSVHEYCFPP